LEANFRRVISYTSHPSAAKMVDSISTNRDSDGAVNGTLGEKKVEIGAKTSTPIKFLDFKIKLK